MSERIGIGIICYYKPDEIARHVASVREHCRGDYVLMLFDNTENDEVGEWARCHAADAVYVRSPYNVGCSRSRNYIAATFARMGVRYFVIQDQDVRYTGDAPAAMRAVFARYKDTGVVSWYLATKQMSGKHSGYSPDDTGAIIETPGMCCMYSWECVKAVGGWNPAFFAYRFDSEFCLRARKGGYKVRVVWPDLDLVRHDHPHQGVKRYPWMHAERQRSKRIFRDEVKRHGLSVPAGL
jgi:GT2 family glycosyltransferase